MKRILIAVVAAALVVGAVGLTALQPVSAQPGGPPVCLSLPPGEHSFTAPAQDREGEVTFTVTVGEGGVVTGFTEPGGQSIPPAAMLDIFAGADAYPLPDGVSFVDCGGDALEGESAQPAAPQICLNLEPGSHNASATASGQTYELVIHVGDNNEVTSIDVLGQSFSAAEAIGLLEQFGAAMPAGIEIVPCEGAMAGDKMDDQKPALYVNAGSGGLADSSNRTGLWSAIATFTVLAIAVTAVTQRRRIAIRNRD